MSNQSEKISLKEKIGYALGDGAANIAWRGVATFLLIYYTDVFGISAAAAGLLMLIARSGDGIIDIIMGVVCDRTNSKHGKFRPWILWTAVPLAITLSLLFTAPNLSESGKLVYAYVTYLSFFLIYTANNIPYGALMAVMTGDDKERTSLGSYRMVGAFAGGIIVQGSLLYLVTVFGNINPTINVEKLEAKKYEVTVSAPKDVASANIETEDHIAMFQWKTKEGKAVAVSKDNKEEPRKSFAMKANQQYSFVVTGEELTKDKVVIIDQKTGYGYSIYTLSIFLAIFLIITFYTTKERIAPPKEQETNLMRDLGDLIRNKPWVVLLLVGLLFNIYNSIKQGVVLYYFLHFVHNQLLAATYMVGLMLISIAGAMLTTPLSKKLGKKLLFIIALIFSGITNAGLYFCGHDNHIGIFSLGLLSEMAAAVFPTLFFAMLADTADYSEVKNGRRATGLIYAAGSFATKLGHGLAAVVITGILTMFHYDGQDATSITKAVPGIIWLMSWIPGVVAGVAALIMIFYPLDQDKLDAITVTLNEKRKNELSN